MHCVAYKSEIIQFRKRLSRKLIKMFYNFQFILLTFLFLARCMHSKFELQDLCVYDRKIILLHTHTTYFLKTSLTTFFFTPLAGHTRHFSYVVVTNRDWPTFC